MKSKDKHLVPIPNDKGVHIKSAGARGEKYVYKYIKFFRNSEGQPRNKARSIGKLSSEHGMMIPNSNYFEIYKVTASMPDVAVWDYGYTWLSQKICSDIGLTEVLHTVFGSRAAEMIAMAAFIIREGNIMDHMAEWQERNYLPDVEHFITSPEASRFFSSITPEERIAFFRLWVKRHYGGKSVCYDVTSVSSYASNLPEVERGYNRDHEDLAQFNLGMFCDEDTRMPLYYDRYNGSLTDRSNLSCVLANAKDIGIEHVHMFMDGGFWSEECIQSLARECDAFTLGMPAYLADAEQAIEQCRSQIERYANELPDYHIYCMEIPSTLYGVAGRIMVYYDPWNHVNLCSEMSESIARMEAQLKKCKRYPKSKLKYFSRYFRLTKHETDNGFDYETDTEKIENQRKNKGFFLLFTNDMEACASSLLYYYRAKDVDEKLFSQIKVDMDGRRIHTHNEQTTDGKTFVTFIACVMRSYMLGKLRQYLQDNSTSMNKVYSQLSNIIMIESEGERRFAKALTKKQREILQQFNAHTAILTSLE